MGCTIKFPNAGHVDVVADGDGQNDWRAAIKLWPRVDEPIRWTSKDVTYVDLDTGTSLTLPILDTTPVYWHGSTIDDKPVLMQGADASTAELRFPQALRRVELKLPPIESGGKTQSVPSIQFEVAGRYPALTVVPFVILMGTMH
jgi:hypothetical protein